MSVDGAIYTRQAFLVMGGRLQKIEGNEFSQAKCRRLDERQNGLGEEKRFL